MINKLTDEQKGKFKDYVEKWKKIGLSTESVDKDRAQKIMNEVYEKILKKKKVPVKVFASPYATWLEVCKHTDKDAKKPMEFIYPYIDGSFSSSWFSFYDFMQKELKIKLNPLYEVYLKTTELGLVYPLMDICFISDKPEMIKMKNGKLHNDNGPVLRYRDGWSLWRLNGVKVNKELVETKTEDLDCKLVLTEKNAEVRREIIRKIGIERVIRDLQAKTIEKSEDGMYELLNLDIIDGRYRPYLKMLNPSISTWHIEGIHPDCKTIEQALAWRNGEDKYEKPEILT